jgi:hypothetical protein
MSLGVDELRKKLKDLGVYHDLYCKDNIKPNAREQD